MSKLTKKEKIILEQIGFYYLKKNDYNYSKTYQEIDMLKIHNLSLNVEKNEIVIELERPGILIGVMGKNFKELILYINNNLKEKYDMKIVEYNISDYLYPHDYASLEDDDDYDDYDDDDYNLIWR